MLFYQTWASTAHGEITKKAYKNNELKISAPKWNKTLHYLMDDIRYHIQDYFEYITRKHGEKADNLPTKIYINKI